MRQKYAYIGVTPARGKIFKKGIVEHSNKTSALAQPLEDLELIQAAIEKAKS